MQPCRHCFCGRFSSHDAGCADQDERLRAELDLTPWAGRWAPRGWGRGLRSWWSGRDPSRRRGRRSPALSRSASGRLACCPWRPRNSRRCWTRPTRRSGSGAGALPRPPRTISVPVTCIAGRVGSYSQLITVCGQLGTYVLVRWMVAEGGHTRSANTRLVLLPAGLSRRSSIG